MKYAQLVYDAPGAWHELSTEEKHALHREYHAVAGTPGVIGHYRLRPPARTTTIRLGANQIVKAEGPLAETRETFGALYLVETEDDDAVFDLAARIPAARTGGAVEVWPLIER